MTKLQERCRIAEQCLPDAPYRTMLTKLHDEMLAALAQQGEPVAWAIYDKRGGSKSIHWAEQHTDGNAEMYNAVPLYKAAPAPQAQEPVLGTKTWFDGEKVITQNLTASDIYAEPAPQVQEPARNVTKEEDAILRGALLRSGTVIHPKPAPQPAQGEP